MQYKRLLTSHEDSFNTTRAELFDALGHPARVSILRALDGRPMGFSELKKEVGIQSSGHLQFHLGKLHNFVQTSEEGFYSLTDDGKEAIRVLRATGANGRSVPEALGASITGRNWTKIILGVILAALLILGGALAYQQGEFSSLQHQMASQQNLIGTLEAGVPFTNAESASLVIGQKNFFSYNASTSQSGLNTPDKVVFDSKGNMWVSEWSNDRILEFISPFSNGMNAYLVIGQKNFTTVVYAATRNGLGSFANFPGGPTGPNSATFDASGNLWVDDGGNNRILEYKPPFKTDMNASLVLGQKNFATSVAADNQSGVDYPGQISFDSLGDLWVADNGNNRALEFKPNFTSGMNAFTVLGQPNFDTNQTSSSSNGFNMIFSSDLGVDPSDDVWVGDAGNNRILEFKLLLLPG